MGGGHAPGAGRRATSEFPPGWSNEHIISVVKDVANDPSEARRQQLNGRWRCAGERFNVHLIVLVEENGHVHTAYPVAGPGVIRNADAARDPANPTVADLQENRISFFADSILTSLADRLSPEDYTHYRTLLWSGEWEELADVLSAHATKLGFGFSADEFSDFEKLLNSYDLPVAGCAFLNDREHVLNQLRPL
ncbi:EndoU domain-containing protein [Amycolatopsis sp. OK19-0408]|uniref:EndoU domain-containing protein n=1 Tax=Amycolatopsis iheyensis TaxID=2945988 RepID=A0A9X2NMN6_9PSEU|nr:EndoU domain-containing protein [Amycolatopsis iheyensis]MCR6489454.1 EndoU domain-containing protein [Amycolatopsis iheyensis]